MEYIPRELDYEILNKCEKIDYVNLILICKDYYNYIINELCTNLDSNSKFMDAYINGDLLSIINSYKMWIEIWRNDDNNIHGMSCSLEISTEYTNVIEYMIYSNNFVNDMNIRFILRDSCKKNHIDTFIYIMTKIDDHDDDLETTINNCLYYAYINKNYFMINYLSKRYKIFKKKSINENNTTILFWYLYEKRGIWESDYYDKISFIVILRCIASQNNMQVHLAK
jgi:hypothetical protein